MEVLYPHCAGLDAHKECVVACVRHMAGGQITSPVKTFKTTTRELPALRGLAVIPRRDAHRHGGDGRLLEAGLAHLVRRRVRVNPRHSLPWNETFFCSPGKTLQVLAPVCRRYPSFPAQ